MLKYQSRPDENVSGPAKEVMPMISLCTKSTQTLVRNGPLEIPVDTYTELGCDG